MRTRHAIPFIFSHLVAAILAIFGTPLSVSAQCLPERLNGVPCAVPARADGLLASAQQAAGPAEQVRRLSVDDAVRLAAENNLGIQISRYQPQIEDLNIAQVRAGYVPSITSTFQSTSRTQPSQNFLEGSFLASDDTIVNNTGVTGLWRWGSRYDLGWNSQRFESNNFSATRNPSLTSNLRLAFTQPLLRNFKIDNLRQQLDVSQINRQIADLDVREQLIATTRAVRNAYWNLSYQMASLDVAQQSLDLAQESLRNTRSRIEIGTSPPIDQVQDEAEVAQRLEAVIVARAQISTAEDTLRALVFNPAAPDFWTIRIQPDDLPAFQPVQVDVNTVIQNALARRSDLERTRKTLDIADVNIEFARNQSLPDVNASLTYNAVGVGGREIERGLGPFGPGTGEPTGGFINRRFGSVLGDLFANDFPTWTFGVQVGYPIGRSTQEAALARTRLQRTQAGAQLRNAQLQVETEVRQRARQVVTNQQRVQTTRTAREAQERRLDAEQRKLAAGTSTNFQVFQAQRDLSQARNNELRAILDYNQSVVDLETVQEAPVR